MNSTANHTQPTKGRKQKRVPKVDALIHPGSQAHNKPKRPKATRSKIPSRKPRTAPAPTVAPAYSPYASSNNNLEVKKEQEKMCKTTNDEKKFKPYNSVANGTPFFRIVLGPLMPILRPISRKLHALRWEVSRPLDIRILPKWVPFIGDISFLTIGQVILALPFLALALAGYYLTFVAPSVDASGKVAGYALIAVFLTASKSNSIFSYFLGISFERLIPYHNMASCLAVILGIFHGYVPFRYGNADGGDDRRLQEVEGREIEGRRLDGSQYDMTGANPDLFKFLFDDDENTTGTLLALAMIFLVLTSLFPGFRRKFFDLWFWVHIGLAISVVIFSIMHELGTIVFLFTLFWITDVLMRYAVMATCQYPQNAKLELVTDDIVKISFEKPENFHYNGGQFVQIALPDLGVYAFHPISISSAPHEKYVTLHVRALGGWSQRLIALAEKKSEASILVEGPYGCVSVDLDNDDRYQMVLCVGGGIGITHCQSVAKAVLNDRKRGRKLKQVRVVWSMRSTEMLKVMNPLETSEDMVDIVMADSESGRASGNLVQTDIFLTKSSSTTPTTMTDGRRVFFGRPDMNAIIEDMKEQANAMGVTHVAVFGCGPVALLDQLKKSCRTHSSSLTDSDGVQFHVHEEIFDF